MCRSETYFPSRVGHDWPPGHARCALCNEGLRRSLARRSPEMKLFGRIGLLVGATLMLASGPAWAKGDDPVSVRIQGPGLAHPVVVRGDMGAPLGDPYWALAHLVLGGSGTSVPIPSALGPG